LLKLPLHVVFVFDGLECLPDKGRKVRSSHRWLTRDFQRMLELFGFHWTEVCPSEAEAELAAMNVHGVIDAVMTEDSDILIFGAPCIIR
ncbi:PIN domain-like protein, partial [Suillus spraguei]